MAEIDWSALRTPDYATNALKATTLGREDGLALAKQNALKTYASDPDAGIKQLMAVDPQSAVTLQRAQAEQRHQATAARAGQLAASGDYTGAGNMALQDGQPDLKATFDALSDKQRDRAAAAYGELASTAYSLKKYPSLEERQARLQAQSARLQALGVTQQQIANFVPSDENIDTFAQAQLGLKGQIEEGRKQRDDAKPSFTTLKDGPVERMVQTNPQADGAVYVPGQGWVGGSPAAASSAPAAPAAPQPGAVAPAPDASAPIGLQNNNPLNLRPLSQGQWNGQTGVNGGYATFDTPQDGWNAAHRNLQTYATAHGINTISGVINRWAPQGDGNNDPQAYAATVAKAVGVDPNAPLDFTKPEVREKVLSAMAQVELGRPYTPPTQGAAPQGQPPAPQPPQSAPQAPAAQPPAGQPGVAGGWQPRTVMTGRAEPKTHEVTTADGVVHTYDISDPEHPKELPIQGVANQPVQILTDPKTNTQYLFNLRTRQATTLDGKPYTPQGAQKIASGTPRSAAVMATQKFIEDYAAAHNGAQPSSDEMVDFYAHLGERAKAAKDFGSGKQGDAVRSFNVGIQHLDTLGRLADALQNGDIQALNAVKQEVAQQTGKPAPNSFNAAKQIVADEIIKAVTGGGGGVGDREKAQAAINRANSPAQLRDVIQTYKDLMGGQLAGLKRQYVNATGFDDFEDKLDPSTRAALEAHTGAGSPGGGVTVQTSRGPVTVRRK